MKETYTRYLQTLRKELIVTCPHCRIDNKIYFVITDEQDRCMCKFCKQQFFVVRNIKFSVTKYIRDKNRGN